MTLKYESELLFDLMKRDGDATPSDVLPYESELKEKYLNQIVGAYPKLQDYRAEWLYYNLYNRLPSGFPVESVTNVTSASFDNVVPYAYKSAILKGSTKYHDIDTGEYLETFEEGRNLELVTVKMPVLTTSNEDGTKTNILTCELVPMNQSMFEKGTFADTTSPNTQTYEQIKLGYKDLYDIRIRTKGTYKVVQGATYVVQLNDGYGIFVCFCKNGLYAATIGRWLVGARTTFTVPNDCDEMFFSIKKTDNSSINPSDYSNIGLKIHQEVELRGVGDVRDELNLLTGEVVERIGEMVLDGSEDWRISGSTRPNHLRLYLITPNLMQHQSVINDKFADNGNIENRDIEGIYVSNTIDIQVEHSRLSDVSVAGFKEWLSNNNIKVQAMLATESVKTVAINCINEHGESVTFKPIEGTMHVSTSSQTLPPLLDMAVPVEATSQNIMSFANIVEEE